MERSRLEASLMFLQLVSIATLLRSIAFDRWITVVMSILLFAGAAAARRNRTWGIALSLATAIWFPVAFLIGIAPFWFVFIGLAGVMPFVHASRAFARFDKSATLLLAALAATFGGIGAIAWKTLAPALMSALPSLRPGMELSHGLAIMAALVGSIVAMRVARPKAGEQLRVAPEEVAHVRVVASAAGEQAELEEESAAERRAFSR